MNMLDVLDMMEATGAAKNSYEWLADNADVDKRLDKETMIGMIIKECGALVPMYKEMQAFMWNHKIWFKANKLVISHLCDTLDYEYNPIENYDWHEVGNKVNNSKRLSDVETATKSSENSNKSYVDTEGTTAMSITDTDGQQIDSYNSTWKDDNVETRDLTDHKEFEDEDKTSAYNEDLYQPEKTNDGTETNKNSGTVTDDGTRKHTGKDTTDTANIALNASTDARVLVHDAGQNSRAVDSSTASSTAELGNDTETHEKYVLGASGTYTKQMMIDQERGIAKFNIYEWIARKYAQDNFYRVY